MILVSIALLPGLIVVVYAWSMAQDDARQRASAEIFAVTKLVVRDQEQWVDEAKSMLATSPVLLITRPAGTSKSWATKSSLRMWNTSWTN